MKRDRVVVWSVVAIATVALAAGGVPMGAAAPSNDNFAVATALVPAGGSLIDSNVAATKEAGEPDHAGDRGGASLWYSWTPSFSGYAVIDTSGSAIDTLLAVYTGSSVSFLTRVASNDDISESGLASRACFFVDPTKTYRIAVDGYDDDEGQLAMAYGPKSDAAPCPILPPTIAGPALPRVGDLLGVMVGQYAGINAPTVAHTWERCIAEDCTDISTAPGYTVQQADLGSVVRVTETVTQGAASASNQADPTATIGMTPTTHPNGRIYWVTKTLVSSFGIDSMLPDGTDLRQVRPPVPVPNNPFSPTVSPDGATVAFLQQGTGLELMNADGSNVQSLGLAGRYPTWSPDGSRLAFIGNDGIDTVDRDGSNETLLVPLAPGSSTGPIDWSPDGTRFAFAYQFPGKSDYDIAVVSASGMGPVAQLTTATSDDHDPAWSPLGDKIAFERGPFSGGLTDGDLYLMNADGSSQTLLYDGDSTHLARDGVDWSPDGTKILFSINSGLGTSQLYTVPASGGTPTQLPGDGYQNSVMSWGTAVAPSSGGGGGGGGGGGTTTTTTTTRSTTTTTTTTPAPVSTTTTTTTPPAPPVAPARTTSSSYATLTITGLKPVHLTATHPRISFTVTLSKATLLHLTLTTSNGKKLASWTRRKNAGKHTITLLLPPQARHRGHDHLRVTETGNPTAKILGVAIAP